MKKKGKKLMGAVVDAMRRGEITRSDWAAFVPKLEAAFKRAEAKQKKISSGEDWV